MSSGPANIATSTMAAPTDNGEDSTRQRKRGAELEQAIRDATVAELATEGYGALTIESVAARAQTGKASIYRRWPTKQDLVLDSICDLMSGPAMSVDRGPLDSDVSTRDALFELAYQAADGMAGPRGDAMRSILSESLRDPEFAVTFEQQFQDPRKQLLNEVLARGVERGEVHPDGLGDLLIDSLAGALVHRYLVRRQPASRDDVARFIDRIVMPALRGPTVG